MKLKYLSLIIVISLSCNPVKKVLNDPAKFDQVAEEVIKRGKCKSDTVTTVKDSIVVKDSIIEIKVPCKDFNTTVSGVEVSASSGELKIKRKDSIVYRTITHTKYDRSLEDLLKKDIAKQDSTIKRKELDLRGLELKNKELSREVSWMTFKFWVLVVAALVIIFRKRILTLLKLFV